MNTRAELLALRRNHLVAQCHAQRADLVLQLQPLENALHSMRIGLRIANRLRQQPGWIAGGIALLMAITPRRLSSLFRYGTLGLRSWRSLAPGLRMLLGRS